MFTSLVLIILILCYLQADNAVPYCDLPMIDRHALFQLENVVKNIRESYESYQFFKIFQVNYLYIIMVFHKNSLEFNK